MCIFCKIVNGELPSHKIYEDENVYAFLDIAPACCGHTLVIPKKHYETIFDCPKEQLDYIMQAVVKISNHYKQNCNFDGVNIFNASGKCAEQTVFHLHFHILPRKEGDDTKLFDLKEIEQDDLQQICQKLKV